MMVRYSLVWDCGEKTNKLIIAQREGTGRSSEGRKCFWKASHLIIICHFYRRVSLIIAMWTVGANFVVMGAESHLSSVQLSTRNTKRLVSSFCKYLLTRKSLSVLTPACDNVSRCCVTRAQDGRRGSPEHHYSPRHC